jgi:hypothetical protein
MGNKKQNCWTVAVNEQEGQVEFIKKVMNFLLN